MGDSASKAALTLQDASAGGGLKSLVSAPLDEHITSEKFWELYDKQARAGFTMPFMGKLTGGGVSSHECTDLEDGSFEINDMVNGGIFAGEMRLRMRHNFDKEKKLWTTKMFDKSFEDKELKETIFIQEIASPFRIEAWTEVCSQRDAGPTIAAVQSMILTAVMERAGSDKKPACQDSVEASDGKLCSLSEALDDATTPDKFWALYVGFVKDGVPKHGRKEHKLMEIDNNNFVVIDVFETGLTTYEKFTFDSAKDTLVSVTHQQDENMSEASAVDKFTTKVRRDPLRVEFYKDVLPGRKTTWDVMGILQNCIDSCIAESASSGSWFG